MLSCIFGTLGKLLEEKHLFRSCQRGGATWIFCPTTILIELYTEPKGRAWQHTRHTPMTHHDRASSAELPRHVSTLPAPCVDVMCHDSSNAVPVPAPFGCSSQSSSLSQGPETHGNKRLIHSIIDVKTPLNLLALLQEHPPVIITHRPLPPSAPAPPPRAPCGRPCAAG